MTNALGGAPNHAIEVTGTFDQSLAAAVQAAPRQPLCWDFVAVVATRSLVSCTSSVLVQVQAEPPKMVLEQMVTQQLPLA
jgi:hypothetical protein